MYIRTLKDTICILFATLKIHLNRFVMTQSVFIVLRKKYNLCFIRNIENSFISVCYDTVGIFIVLHKRYNLCFIRNIENSFISVCYDTVGIHCATMSRIRLVLNTYHRQASADDMSKILPNCQKYQQN